MATYVVGPVGSGGMLKRSIRKYVDWDPQGGGTAAPLTESPNAVGEIPMFSKVFTAGNGLIYETTNDGKLNVYKDQTDSGGPLLKLVKTHAVPWKRPKQIWSNGPLIHVLNNQGGIDRYSQSDPVNGTGTITKIHITIPPTAETINEISSADDVWSVGNSIYALKNGTVRQWRSYSAGLMAVKVVATGLTGALQGWSPGPGTFYTMSNDEESEGVVKSYTESPFIQVNDEVRTGISGHVMADVASCLAPADPSAKPFSSIPEDPDVPAAPAESAEPLPSTGPSVFSGKFTLGNGAPASGLPVLLEATDVVPENGSAITLPTLGQTVTAADGTWSIPLPSALPGNVEQAAAENGGVVNAVATVAGQTSSGIQMTGVSHLSAAPVAAAPEVKAQVADAEVVPAALQPTSSSSGSDEPTSLADSTANPRDAQYAQSWGSKLDASLADRNGDSPLPKWQSATGDIPTEDPYVINGVNTASMPIEAKDGGCDRTKSEVIDKKIYYTTVGEAHAFWDAKASFDYDNKVSSTVETAAKVGSKWTVTGSVTLGSAIGSSTGYTNKGSYYAKQWKIPLLYTKIKETWRCGGGGPMLRYVIKPGKYTVPAGGATGKYGKDVRHLDGSKFFDSPKKHRAYVPAGSYFQISRNKSVKWSGAVSAFGVSLGGSTSYDKDHRQRITAGNAKNAKHYIWGAKDNVSGKPGVFYSY
ncbi:hypothetical protein OG413_21005 [Streptomyces sp. NBC_01433]|uniref:hypothetical protein n=1 Tax=Streptomyces sp. NBC_01433 TaxID=2903864 RepID=UPI0022534008|nr:hypothetical protein [Streptomyces sp. NBC_01433]MCX4677756.1 hypothetical protein [Streptomyces sp. NBC_01433]